MPIGGLAVVHRMVMAKYFTESNKRYGREPPWISSLGGEIAGRKDKRKCGTRSLLASW